MDGRDQTKLLDGVGRQIAAVHAAVGDEIAESDTMLTAVLCFVDTEWGLLTKPFKVDGIQVTWPKALVVRLRQPGPLTAEQVAALAERLSKALPAA